MENARSEGNVTILRRQCPIDGALELCLFIDGRPSMAVPPQPRPNQVTRKRSMAPSHPHDPLVVGNLRHPSNG
jgi:hypothetical protein